MIDETGSVLPLTAIFMTVLLGMTALVLDAGSWYRADSELQAVADAAALAGASALPDETAAAAVARTYAAKNGATAGVAVEFSDGAIQVSANRRAPGFFSRVFGVDDVEVAATAAARATVPTAVRWVMPIAVSERNPMLACRCFGTSTTMNLATVGAPGNFGFVDVAGSPNNGTPAIASLIRTGHSGYLSPGWYGVFPGNRWNAAAVRSALAGRVGQELVLPVYRSVTGNGNGARYRVIAFAGFVLESVQGSTLRGRFVRVTADGTGEAPATQANLGLTTYTRLTG